MNMVPFAQTRTDPTRPDHNPNYCRPFDYYSMVLKKMTAKNGTRVWVVTTPGCFKSKMVTRLASDYGAQVVKGKARGGPTMEIAADWWVSTSNPGDGVCRAARVSLRHRF